jgi:hypothetical protein
LACIAKNRTESSYLAGGAILNMDWPRLSDDIDIFHDTDEEIGTCAQHDCDSLTKSGFLVHIAVNIYGCVEAEVSKDGDSTLVQWMSETRTRFFPLIHDEDYGTRLHPADLAINKVLAASARRKPRDFVDLVLISERYCPLGPLIMAAAGKPPYFSPVKTIEEIRRKGLSISNEEFQTVKGLPEAMNPQEIRETLQHRLEEAEGYARTAPADIVGILVTDAKGMPQQISNAPLKDFTLRKATSNHEAVPQLPEIPNIWQ